MPAVLGGPSSSACCLSAHVCVQHGDVCLSACLPVRAELCSLSVCVCKNVQNGGSLSVCEHVHTGYWIFCLNLWMHVQGELISPFAMHQPPASVYDKQGQQSQFCPAHASSSPPHTHALRMPLKFWQEAARLRRCASTGMYEVVSPFMTHITTLITHGS